MLVFLKAKHEVEHFDLIMPAFVAEFGTVGLIIFSVDVILSLCVATNFFMAALIDPGIIPSIDSARAEITDDFRTPLYKNVDIRGITVKLKWCISCHIYRPPRSSHCAICNQCIENLFFYQRKYYGDYGYDRLCYILFANLGFSNIPLRQNDERTNNIKNMWINPDIRRCKKHGCPDMKIFPAHITS
uniref:Palmitoyltransferase n=1 Tax=Romanomermis culicivorax TaxID=13658 RepID=A0A915I7Y5_ROMCU